jgi:hypothetical protein
MEGLRVETEFVDNPGSFTSRISVVHQGELNIPKYIVSKLLNVTTPLMELYLVFRNTI